MTAVFTVFCAGNTALGLLAAMAFGSQWSSVGARGAAAACLVWSAQAALAFWLMRGPNPPKWVRPAVIALAPVLLAAGAAGIAINESPTSHHYEGYETLIGLLMIVQGAWAAIHAFRNRYEN